MATTAQVLANRDNAQLSTGPKTIEGKAKSANNAIRHQLTARGLIVPLGLESAFESLESNLRLELNPRGALQEILFKRILESTWNLERCRLAEAQLFDSTGNPQQDPLLDGQNEAKFARIQKYARQYENSMLKFMRELGNLQTELRFRQEIQPLTDNVLADPKLLEQSPHALPPIVNYRRIIAAAKSTGTTVAQIKAKADREFMLLLERATLQPELRHQTAA